jgi:DNA-directed RNA polymerase I, II, and III subunit RPABC2
MSDDEYSDNDSLGSNDSLEEENPKTPFLKKSLNHPNLPSFVKKTTPILNEDDIEDEDDDVEDADDIEDVEEEDPNFIGKNDVLEEDLDEEEDEESDIEEPGDEDDDDYVSKKTSKNKKTGLLNTNTNSNTLLEENIKKNSLLQEFDDSDDDDQDDNENYLQKFNADINHNYLMTFHPETKIHNYDEIAVLTKIVRDKNGQIIDPLHRTASYLTKFEKARVLGQRSKQIECGAKPFIKVPENLIEGYMIAELELKEKKIPFIIRRPLSNGTCEYWNLRDLDLL